MSPLTSTTLTLASAAAAWCVATSAARRRGIGLGWPPVLTACGLGAFAAVAPPHALAPAVLLGGLSTAAICDGRTGLIFAPLTTAIAGATLAAAALDGHIAGAGIGAVSLGATLFALHVLTAGRGIGFGDVRLGVGLGAGLGAYPGFVALGWAFVFGGVVATLLLLTRRIGRGGTLRFAPYMAAGALAVLAPALPG
jgi:leader peptidase (prepilin peptidase)/N-methyltransferase